MSKLLGFFCSVIVYGLVTFTSAIPASAQSQEKFYFWVVDSAVKGHESFVIEVDAAKKADIERFWAEGKAPNFRGRIAAEPASYNRNYNAPGHPVWNWHVVAVEEIVDIFSQSQLPFEWPPRDGKPSDIAADPQRWIAQYGDTIGFQYYFITREIDATRPDVLANVSNRGMTGAGEKTLITGVIINGGEPRNVVVRALGPSLTGYGVQQAARNPKIEVYRGSSRIASNADWKTDARANSLAQNYPTLVPENDKEAALLVTLLPGAYTIHGVNEDGTEGVMLIEAYDVDAAP